MAMLLPMLTDPEVRKGMGKLTKNLLVFGGLGVGILLFVLFAKRLDPLKAIKNFFGKGFGGISDLFKSVFPKVGGLTEYRPGVGMVDPYGAYGSKTSPEMVKLASYKKERTAETMRKLKSREIRRASLGR